MQVIARHDMFRRVCCELEQVVGAAPHEDSAARWKYDRQRVHQDRDMIVESLDLFYGGRIVRQELFGHITRSNRQRFCEGRRWPFTLDSLCAPASTIHDQQWHLRHRGKGGPAIV